MHDTDAPPPLVPSASRAARRGEDVATNWNRGRPHTVGFTKPAKAVRKSKARTASKRAKTSRKMNR